MCRRPGRPDGAGRPEEIPGVYFIRHREILPWSVSENCFCFVLKDMSYSLGHMWGAKRVV